MNAPVLREVGCRPGRRCVGAGNLAQAFGYATFIGSRTVELVDQIVASDPDAVIVVFSDHGTETQFNAGDPLGTNFDERSSNFLAARTPGQPALLPAGTTPINVLTGVLNGYFGTATPSPAGHRLGMGSRRFRAECRRQSPGDLRHGHEPAQRRANSVRRASSSCHSVSPTVSEKVGSSHVSVAAGYRSLLVAVAVGVAVTVVAVRSNPAWRPRPGPRRRRAPRRGPGRLIASRHCRGCDRRGCR